MNYAHFLRIEKDENGKPKNYVVHTVDPKFAIELEPDCSAPDKVGQGILKRLCVPNSWAGDYGKYAKLVSAAQEFFEQASKAPSGKFRL